jgi:hypothetical protein
MNLHEGSRVSYVGDGSDGRTLGEHGRLLTLSHSHANVQWDDGKVTPHYIDFLAPLSWSQPRTAALSDGLEDSLDVGTLHTKGVLSAFDAEGSAGALNHLSTTGALSAFGEIAEEARIFVASRLRQDPAFREAIAQLDDEEREDIIGLASHVLLRDSFSDE